MRGRLLRREALDEAQRIEMRALLERYFDGVRADAFEGDLRSKNWVIRLEDDAGRLAGFSTIDFARTRLAGRTCSVVYSGDTIVEPRAWGSSALARTWIASVLDLYSLSGEGPLLWLLIVSGYRTYRMLPVFWRRFHPRHDGRSPGGYAGLARELATRRFCDRYDPRRGVVRLAHPQRLRGNLIDVPGTRRADPHVDFFLRANPGHAHGDELVCLTEIERSNLTPAGERILTAAACAPIPERRATRWPRKGVAS